MPQLPFSDLNLDRRHGRAGSSSRVLPPKRVPQAAASGAWVRNAARVVIRGSRSARQPIRQGELRPSLRAGRRSGVLARTSISARLNRGGPDVICRVQSGASDELPLSGHALRWQSVASAGRRRLTERRACGRTTCSCCSAQWRPHTRGKPRLLDVGRRILARDRFAPDSPLEETRFEPSVPRDTPKFSTPAHVTCLTPCTRKSRREREPILRGCRPPPAEPMVRIRLPPAVSRLQTGPAGSRSN